jgi:predicted nucleic acid-binding protein
MEVAELIREMFQLPETFAVPDILFLEELVEHHPELPGFGLQVLQMPEEVIQDGTRLRGRYSRPSTNDLLALALAKYQHCPLLTGDGHLRRAAEQEQIEVHGTLWLLESLLEAGHIDFARLELVYARLREVNRRLPWDDVQRQVDRLRNR